MPVPLLALMYWAHLLATVIWLGGLAMLVLIAWPGAAGDASTLGMLERRFRPWANLSLIVLLVTGLIQMGGDAHYQGFLVIRDVWSLGLLGKHLVIGAMIIIAAALQWGVYPALERARLAASRGSAADQAAEAALQAHLRRLSALNLALGAAVLLLTALITAL